VGIWVSGFYGSGKSSFAKNFGLAMDKGLVINGTPFKERLVNRINHLPSSQLLNNLVENYSPQIFLINLATKQLKLHGNTLPPVSDVIYHQVMKWAGYAPEEKIALLERKLEMDGRLDEFKTRVRTEKKEEWDKVKFEDTLTAIAIAQDLAPVFYPNIWKDAASFNVMRIDSVEDESERMKAMFNIIKKRTGKENVLFIIDEVGQYISAKEELILHLQGTLENMKDIGKGKAWLLATAQQTLTEDNPNARFNSDKLYKLNDRFPVKVDIEASDIKEITRERLLGKSKDGEEQLKALFNKYGEQLRLNTRLTNVQRTIYDSSLDERAFIDLYPFLPYQFDIILSLLARMAKKTGGIGLRSAIRVIQDSLTGQDKQVMLAEKSLGDLATTYHIFDVMRGDISKSYPHIFTSVEKILSIPAFGPDSLEGKIAKSVAILQILDDFHLSVENLAVAMHPKVSGDGMLKEVRKKVEELKSTPGLTLKEIDGQLRFMTDAIIRIEDEKKKIHVSVQDSRRVLDKILEDIFMPVPSARIQNTKTVKTGIQLVWGDRLSKIAEPNEEIQTQVQFFQKSKYEDKFNELKHLSTEKGHEDKMLFVGVLDKDIDAILEEIVRCEGIYGTRNRYNDKEITDYLTSQFQEAKAHKDKLIWQLAKALEKGDFIFRGQSKPAEQLGTNLKEMSNAWLKTCADKIFHKYNQAPVVVESNATEKFLRFDDLNQMPVALRFFEVIKSDGGINDNIPAVQSIKDYLQSEGQVDGRKITEHFSGIPYGWHKDSIRYLVAAMFVGSVVKLRIAGDFVTVKGPTSIEKLSNIQGFNQIGVALYTEGQPSQKQTLSAQKNLIILTGENVPPLPQRISAVVMKFFPQYQTKYADLPLRLENLDLPGIEKAKQIKEGIEEILKGDASDATFRLGKEDSELFVALRWAQQLYQAIDNGMEAIIREIRNLQSKLAELPAEETIVDLKNMLEGQFHEVGQILLEDDFYNKMPELKDKLLEIKNKVNETCGVLRLKQNEKIKITIEDLKKTYNWKKISDEEKKEFIDRLESFLITDKEGINGLREIINESYQFTNEVDKINLDIEKVLIAQQDPSSTKRTRKVKMSHLPRSIKKKEDIDVIIEELKKIQNDLNDDEIIELNW